MLCVEVLDPIEIGLPDVGMLTLRDVATGAELDIPTGEAGANEPEVITKKKEKAADDE